MEKAYTRCVSFFYIFYLNSGNIRENGDRKEVLIMGMYLLAGIVFLLLIVFLIDLAKGSRQNFRDIDHNLYTTEFGEDEFIVGLDDESDYANDIEDEDYGDVDHDYMADFGIYDEEYADEIGEDFNNDVRMRYYQEEKTDHEEELPNLNDFL